VVARVGSQATTMVAGKGFGFAVYSLGFRVQALEFEV